LCNLFWRKSKCFHWKTTLRSKNDVWCEFTAKFILEPFFFLRINSRWIRLRLLNVTVTVNGAWYLQWFKILLSHNCKPEIFSIKLHSCKMEQLRTILQNLFLETFGNNKVISRFFSSEMGITFILTSCDYRLFKIGNSKSKVFCPSRTLNQLKDLIREAICGITVEMLVVYNLIPRLDKIEENNGQHIQ